MFCIFLSSLYLAAKILNKRFRCDIDENDIDEFASPILMLFGKEPFYGGGGGGGRGFEFIFITIYTLN